MLGNYKLPLPNKQILVWKWRHQPDGEIVEDCDEINSNQFNPAFYDGWEYINK